MMWLAWRQLRTEAAIVFGVLVAVAITLALTGPNLVHLYDTTVAPCGAHGDCGAATNAFMRNDRLLYKLLSDIVLIMPALIGIFWGAPLIARELETRTYGLAWTQSVTRTRWVATKLGLVGLASVATAGLLSLMVTWWSSPLDRVAMDPFAPSFFDRRGIVPLGYAAFAFALGVLAGVVIRRTLPAMAATLVAFIGSRFAFLIWLRPHLMTALTKTVPFLVPGGQGVPSRGINPADWVISDQTINGAGQVIGQNGGFGPNGDFGMNVSNGGVGTLPNGAVCPNMIPSPRGGSGPALGAPSQSAANAFQTCLHRLHIREVLSYQPISRYWPFQIIETAIFVALALALVGVCIWWVRHRLR